MQVLPLPLHLLLIPRNRFATNGESSTTASSTLFGCAKPFFLGGAIAGRNLFVHTEDEVASGVPLQGRPKPLQLPGTRPAGDSKGPA
jgi:hypothetical protein